MKILELAKLATSELVQMARKGDLAPQDLWVAIKGAQRYATAVAQGKINSLEEQIRIADICLKCPSRMERVTALKDVIAGHCGEPFKPTATTCGCLVTLTVGGTPQPAGKTVVAGQKCPQGKW